MKKITQKLFFFIIAVIGVSITTAQVAPNGQWTPIGNTTMSTVTDDADNGDSAGDGALFFNGQDTTPDLGAKFTFNGTMEEATTYAVDTYTYNTGGSFCNFVVSLHNKTDDIELVASSTVVVQSSDTGATLTSLTYDGVSTDVGDVLELRYTRVDPHTARDFKIDNASLNGAFVTEALVPVSTAGTWGIVDTNTVLQYFGDDGVVIEETVLVNGNNPVETLEGAKFTLTEAMVDGQRYKAETTIYNPRVSYINVLLQLYNVTEGVALATSSRIQPATGGGQASGDITYDAIASDAGDVLEIRWIRDDGGNASRDFGIIDAIINGAAIVVDPSTLSASDNVLSNAISVYPNPSSSLINISIENLNIKNVKLIDVTGKVIYNNNSAKSIDVSNYSKGLYILKIASNEGGVASKKVVIN